MFTRICQWTVQRDIHEDLQSLLELALIKDQQNNYIFELPQCNGISLHNFAGIRSSEMKAKHFVGQLFN